MLIFSNVCFSQLSVRVNAGCSYNHLITDIFNDKFTRNEDEIGYSVDSQIEYNITKIIGLEVGIGWIQKNYFFRRTDKYLGIFNDYTNNYLQIPITIPVRILERKKCQVFLNNGIFVSYLISAKVVGIMPNAFNTTNQSDIDGQSIQSFNLTTYSEYYQFNPIKDNRFEFGLQTGVGLQYNINKKIAFILDYRFYQSLTDIQKKYMINQVSKVNQTSILSIGFKFKFNSKKDRSIL